MATIHLQPKTMSYNAKALVVKWLPDEQETEPGSGVWLNKVHYSLIGEFLDGEGNGTGREFVIEDANDWMPSDARSWEKNAVQYKDQINAILSKWGFTLDEEKGITFQPFTLQIAIPTQDEVNQ